MFGFRSVLNALPGSCGLHGGLLHLRIPEHERLDVAVAGGGLQTSGTERQLAGPLQVPGRARSGSRSSAESLVPPQVFVDHHDGHLLRNLGLVREDADHLEDVLPADVRTSCRRGRPIRNAATRKTRSQTLRLKDKKCLIDENVLDQYIMNIN